MKKKLLILFLLLSFSFYTTTVNAAIGVSDDTGNTVYTPGERVMNNTLATGVNFQKEIGSISSSKESKNVAVSILSGKQNADLKVVSWALQDKNYGFKKAHLSEIAKDYEKNHPGWRVMGISNADQFTLGRGTDLGGKGHDPYIEQTYYPFIADSESWFSITANGNSGNFVAILGDGSVDPLNRVTASLNNIAGLYLSILNENGEVVNKFRVDHLNKNPNEGETSIFSPYYTDLVGSIPNLQVQGNFLSVIENAELAYVSNTVEYANLFAGTPKASKANDGFFGRGTITKITDNYSVGKGQFLISSNNPIIQSALKEGIRVRAQYEYKDSIPSFESGIGFHTIQRDNNKDGAVSGDYNINSRPRSVIGRKADGTVCLVVIDDYNDSYGVTGYGLNAILKNNEIVEAYQMDGGGSAQMFIRDGNTFTPVTRSADVATGDENMKQQRSVLNALLVVVREIDLVHEQISATTSSVTLKVEIENTYGKEIKSIWVRIGTRKYEVEGGIAKITGLSANKEFEYKISIENMQGIDSATIYSGKIRTAKRMPKITDLKLERINGEYIFTPIIQDVDETLSMPMMKIGPTSRMLENGVFKFPFISGAPILKYTYDLNDGNGLQHGEYYYNKIINARQVVDELIINQNHTISNVFQ